MEFDIPENIGTDHMIMNLTFFQIIRIIFYVSILIVLSFFINAFFAIIIPLAIFAVIYKIENVDLDIYFYMAFLWFISKKNYDKSMINDKIYIKGKDRNGIIWEYSEGWMMALRANGISLDLMDENDKNEVFENFLNFLNSLDFSLNIYVYSVRGNINYAIKNEKLYSIGKSIENLIRKIESNYWKKIFLIVLNISYGEIKGEKNFNFVREKLMERYDVLRKGLSNIGIDVEPLTMHEYSNLYLTLW